MYRRPPSLWKNWEKRLFSSLFSRFFLREGGRLYTGYQEEAILFGFYSNWKDNDAHIFSIFSDFTIKRFKTSRNFTENKSYIGPQNGVGIPDGRSSSVKMHLACQWKHWNNHIVSSEFVRIHDKFPYFKTLPWFSQSVSVSIEIISRFWVVIYILRFRHVPRVDAITEVSVKGFVWFLHYTHGLKHFPCIKYVCSP